MKKSICVALLSSMVATSAMAAPKEGCTVDVRASELTRTNNERVASQKVDGYISLLSFLSLIVGAEGFVTMLPVDGQSDAEIERNFRFGAVELGVGAAGLIGAAIASVWSQGMITAKEEAHEAEIAATALCLDKAAQAATAPATTAPAPEVPASTTTP